MVALTERIPTGGPLVPFDPVQAAWGYMNQPGASYNAYGARQFQDFFNRTQPRALNAYGGFRQGFNLGVPQGVNQASKAFRYGTRLAKGIPYLPAAGNLLEGDLAGAGMSAAGVLAGSAIAGPLGGVVGGMFGEPVIKGTGKLVGGIVGGVSDWSDPLSGKDISLLGVPLTPYAKTKSKQRKALALAEMRLPLYNKIAQAETQRNMALNSMNNAGQIISNVYGTNPFR